MKDYIEYEETINGVYTFTCECSVNDIRLKERFQFDEREYRTSFLQSIPFSASSNLIKASIDDMDDAIKNQMQQGKSLAIKNIRNKEQFYIQQSQLNKDKK